MKTKSRASVGLYLAIGCPKKMLVTATGIDYLYLSRSAVIARFIEIIEA